MRKSILAILFITLMAYAQNNIDSLRWINIVNETDSDLQKQEKFLTAKTLADIGLYSEALEVVGAEKTVQTAEKKPLMADVEGLYFYNKSEDINEKELNSSQKDSVSLLQSHHGGLGFHLYIPSGSPYLKNGKKRKVPTEITPLAYFTNTVSRLAVNSKSYFFDSLVTTNVELSAEKVVGLYAPDTTIDSLFVDDTLSKVDTTIIPDKFMLTDFKPDSSDLLSCIAQVQYEKMFDNFSITFPVRWLHYLFRTNKPILSSRSNISINPGFHYFNTLGKLNLDLSASVFMEHQNHFGTGRVRDTLSRDAFNSDYYDKDQFNPQFASEFSLGPVTVGHTFLMLWENFSQRQAQMDEFAIEQIDSSFSLGVTLKNRWINNTVKGELEFSDRVSYDVQVDILAALEEYCYTKYEQVTENIVDGLTVKAATKDKKGTLYTIEQKVPCKIGSFLTLSPSFTMEWRYAPISDSLTIGTKNAIYLLPIKERMFLWESYKTQGFGFTVQHRSNKGIISFEQKFNKEMMTVDDDIQTNLYKRFDGKVSESKLQTQLNFKHGFSLSLNGLYSRRKSQDLSEEKLEIIKQNIAANVSIVKKITFRNRNRK